MPVTTYVYRDYAERPTPPVYNHETNATIDIVKRLWTALHHQETHYAVISNIQDQGYANADMVIVSERGLGVIELKHHHGPVSWIGNDWYAGSRRLQTRSGLNPHQQVQGYADSIRELLLESKLDWKRDEYLGDSSLKVYTAVCFTNPDASIQDLQRWLPRLRLSVSPWEVFSVLKPQDIVQWAVSLSFEKSVRSEVASMGYEPYRLWHDEMVGFVTEFLDSTEWREIEHLMPTADPYGVLVLLENDTRQAVFTLDRDEITVGRDPLPCNLVIPQQYARVSKQHAAIQRIGQKVWIQDLGSTNGTFIDGKHLAGRKVLKYGQRITLGGPSVNDKVCTLEFLPTADYVVDRTEQQTD